MAVLSSSPSPSVVGPCGPSRERAAVSRDDWAAAKDGVSKKKTKEKNHKTDDIPERGAYKCKDTAVLSSSPSPSVLGPCGPSRERVAVSRGDWAAAKEGVSEKTRKRKIIKHDMTRAAARGTMRRVRVASTCPVLPCVVAVVAVGCGRMILQHTLQ
jgi:hypothetical protein